MAYTTLHHRVVRARGKASGYPCSRCKGAARDWAQIHGTDGTDPAHYSPMCHRCHFAYDQVGERQRGVPKGRKGIPLPANRGRSWNVKLDEAKVREIRALLAAGDLSNRAIGRMYGVSHNAIAKIRDGGYWSWVA